MSDGSGVTAARPAYTDNVRKSLNADFCTGLIQNVLCFEVYALNVELIHVSCTQDTLWGLRSIQLHEYIHMWAGSVCLQASRCTDNATQPLEVL